jgi:hypothetical protein
MNADRLRALRAHIEMRKTFEKSNMAQMQAMAGRQDEGGAMGAGGPAQSQLPGRAGGETAEAMEGAYGPGGGQAGQGDGAGLLC